MEQSQDDPRHEDAAPHRLHSRKKNLAVLLKKKKLLGKGAQSLKATSQKLSGEKRNFTNLDARKKIHEKCQNCRNK